MKGRIYIRAARDGSQLKVAATSRATYHPLTVTKRGKETALPTAMFALDLEIPEEALKRAEQVAATVALDAAGAQVLVTQPEVEGS